METYRAFFIPPAAAAAGRGRSAATAATAVADSRKPLRSIVFMERPPGPGAYSGPPARLKVGPSLTRRNGGGIESTHCRTRLPRRPHEDRPHAPPVPQSLG